MKMNCEESRQLLRLDVGHDLRPQEQPALQKHVQRCAACLSYRKEMESVMAILSTARDSDPIVAADQGSGVSCWTRLNAAITERKRSRKSAQTFNGRVIALCVCSLLLAVGTVVQQLPSARIPASNSLMPGQHMTGMRTRLGSTHGGSARGALRLRNGDGAETFIYQPTPGAMPPVFLPADGNGDNPIIF
jgi:predicted anti-sigma-YlaC factor YlaD